MDKVFADSRSSQIVQQRIFVRVGPYQKSEIGRHFDVEVR